jgi:hypothetical protein
VAGFGIGGCPLEFAIRIFVASIAVLDEACRMDSSHFNGFIYVIWPVLCPDNLLQLYQA